MKKATSSSKSQLGAPSSYTLEPFNFNLDNVGENCAAVSYLKKEIFPTVLPLLEQLLHIVVQINVDYGRSDTFPNGSALPQSLEGLGFLPLHWLARQLKAQASGISSRFELKSGFARDKRQDLVWCRDTISTIGLVTFSDAVIAATSKGSLGSSAWRLPTTTEALSLLNVRGDRVTGLRVRSEVFSTPHLTTANSSIGVASVDPVPIWVADSTATTGTLRPGAIDLRKGTSTFFAAKRVSSASAADTRAVLATGSEAQPDAATGPLVVAHVLLVAPLDTVTWGTPDSS